MQHGYLVVEGPHDVEFVGAVLKPHGFKRVQLLEKLDPFWVPLVPRSFPYDDDLLRRVPVPTFFASATHSVAIDSAIGDTKLVKTLRQTFTALPDLADRLASTAILLDADNDKRTSLSERFNVIHAGMRSLALAAPDQPGHVTAGTPRCGIFVFPDNSTPGTLEDLLLDAAAQVYPTLLASAARHVHAMHEDQSWARGRDQEELGKPAGVHKATVAAIASVLKPGKAIQTSIQDNRWLDPAARATPRIRSFAEFLASLLDLPDIV